MAASPYVELVRLFRIVQRRNRAVLHVGSGVLTLAESHLLTELNANGSLTASDLCELTKLNKQNVSRLLKNLENSGYLSSKLNKSDQRQKVLKLTAKGKSAVLSVDKDTNARLNKLIDGLSVKQRGEVESFFKQIADGFSIPTIKKRPSDKGLRVQIRRITRAFGLLGSNVFESNLSSLDWHLLAEIFEAKTGLGIKELTQVLGVKQTTISQAIKRLEARQLIARHNDPNDLRRSIIALTFKGQQKLEEISNQGGSLLEKALSNLSADECKTLIKYLTTMAGIESVTPQFALKRLKGDNALKRARKMAIEFYATCKGDMDIPGVLFSDDSYVLACFVERELAAAIEFKHNSSKKLVACNLVFDREAISPTTAERFANDALRFIQHELQPAKINIHDSAKLRL
ncbi:MAG: MarR family transcriptional regulator [Deltaproteobacteria bacterium]|nr:MarR family transcriptional regulator [Deltaproteobacteria bacterium]